MPPCSSLQSATLPARGMSRQPIVTMRCKYFLFQDGIITQHQGMINHQNLALGSRWAFQDSIIVLQGLIIDVRPNVHAIVQSRLLPSFPVGFSARLLTSWRSFSLDDCYCCLMSHGAARLSTSHLTRSHLISQVITRLFHLRGIDSSSLSSFGAGQ